MPAPPLPRVLTEGVTPHIFEGDPYWPLYDEKKVVARVAPHTAATEFISCWNLINQVRGGGELVNPVIPPSASPERLRASRGYDIRLGADALRFAVEVDGGDRVQFATLICSARMARELVDRYNRVHRRQPPRVFAALSTPPAPQDLCYAREFADRRIDELKRKRGEAIDTVRRTTEELTGLVQEHAAASRRRRLPTHRIKGISDAPAWQSLQWGDIMSMADEILDHRQVERARGLRPEKLAIDRSTGRLTDARLCHLASTGAFNITYGEARLLVLELAARRDADNTGSAALRDPVRWANLAVECATLLKRYADLSRLQGYGGVDDVVLQGRVRAHARQLERLAQLLTP